MSNVNNSKKKCVVFAVSNAKGGVGKTTTTVSLAAGLAKLMDGKGRVCVIDLDPQGNASIALGLKPGKKAVEDFLVEYLLRGEIDGAGYKELLAASLIEASREGLSRPGLYVLPSTPKLATAKAKIVRLSDMSDTPSIDNIFEEVFGRLRSAFDFIILDTPPTLDTFEVPIYRFADYLIIPSEVDSLSEAGVAQKLQSMKRLRDAGVAHIDLLAVVPIKYDRREVLGRHVYDVLLKHVGKDKMAEPIPRTVLMQQAPASGMTIYEYALDSPPALAYWELVKRVAETRCENGN